MNKKIIYLGLFLGLLCAATFVSATTGVSIANPLAGSGVTTFCQLLTKIIEEVSAVIASVGTIMIIYSGILYLTSAGSQERMTKAKTALVYAVVGIFIGVAATVIVEIIKGVVGASGTTC